MSTHGLIATGFDDNECLRVRHLSSGHAIIDRMSVDDDGTVTDTDFGVFVLSSEAALALAHALAGRKAQS